MPPWLARVPWVVLCAALVFFAVCFPLTSTDIWWHLAAGRWIVEQGQLPTVDPFVLQGRPWIDLHWLFQLGALGVFRLGGPSGLVLVKAALVALGGALLVLAARGPGRTSWPLAALLVAAPVCLARPLALARPVVVTLVALALFLLVLERYRQGRRPRVLLWLLPVQLLWANAQGGLQLLGPALVIAYLVGDGLALALSRGGDRAGRRVVLDPGAQRRARLGWLALLVPGLLLVALATPYGLDGLALPFKLLGRIDPLGGDLFRQSVSENVPPWQLERAGGAPLEVTSFKWVAALAFASFLVPIARRRPLALSRLLLLCGLLALALTANRNILLFNWLAGPVAAANLHAVAPESRRWRVAAAVLALCGLSVLAVLRHLGGQGEVSLDRPTPFRVPDRAVERLQQLGLDRGPLHCSVRYGGYLIWRLFPRARPTMDGRLVLRSAAELAEHLDIADRPELFEAYRRRRGVRVALLPAALPDRYLPLVVHLQRSPDWRLLATDGTQTLFVHRSLHAAAGLDLGSASTVREIARELERRWSASPAVLERARLHLGRLLAAVGARSRAREVLSRCAGREARSLLARVLYLEGRVEEARRMAAGLLARHGDDVNDLVLLARITLERGARSRAVDLLERALALEPTSAQARRLLAAISR